ncbi:type I restriction-modification system endonuclease [Elizabethkingia anophelis]|nr:type I restriction-modification system endonuclease [Elizabethkingia anophelis]MCT3634139.1 type I restriction-modification system endonuclease [Elizabethkingia anophelis]MCT3830867.1 type I restriction-modification system endonuclease [Elizabethkingia anophelis]MCT3884343.1 type I restriction-modification system endonuclease [Elizabethkingia anophelis]MCT3894838.1 type I restriction-modification system endonuclease [Elizabethkingia anophelis]
MASKFSFLQPEYDELFQFATVAEKLYFVDASSSISKTRLVCEKLIALIGAFEEISLEGMVQFEKINHLSKLNILPDTVGSLFHMVRTSGNVASHHGYSTKEEALKILESAHKLLVWFYETYENDYIEDKSYFPTKPEETNAEVVELNRTIDGLTLQLQKYEAKIKDFNSNEDKVSSRRKLAEQRAEKISWSERETRVQLIDAQLRDAGWECDTENLNWKTKKTFPEKGRNLAIAEWQCGNLYADYALFVGTELYGVVEAKKFATDISTNLHQSKKYAENIKEVEDVTLMGEWDHYKVPFLFSTNGRKYLEQLKTKSGIWFLDIRKPNNRATVLKGWYSPESLKELYEKDIDKANKKLEESSTDYLTSATGLNLRHFQIEAIKAVEDKIISHPGEKSALIVMATGTGKTRTINGLIYRLIKADRFKRILFLTDRTLLAKQAKDSINENKIEVQQSFGGIYKFEYLKTKIPDSETRLHFATVQSMVKRLFYSDEPPLTVDTYDCIIIDEAHRGYQLDKELDEEDISFKDEEDYVAQYRKVIDYFDAFRIGMTATPALHTTQIFGESVYDYSYRQAVIDGYLVDHEPPHIIKTILNTDGIRWEKGEKPQLYDPETGEIIDLAELEDELNFEVEQFNKKVLNDNFNRAVIQELVQHLDPDGNEKTLIFAARDSHADTIVQMLKEEFEEIGVDVHHKAIEKITGSVYNVEQLVQEYKNERYPNIAVTVDLLTTGIDVTPICNLVFMRRVKSRILFEQMIGRATRLCPEIGKESFKIFDAVRIYEALEPYTQMKAVANPSTTFQQLVAEMEYIDNPERLEKQRDQIIAKLNRKIRKLTKDQQEQFVFLSGDKSVSEFLEQLKKSSGDDLRNLINEKPNLWEYLDVKVYQPQTQYISNHVDMVQEVSRGYGKAEKPEDYIEGFKKFISENRNEIAAISIICSKPEELDRKSLKELKLLLDEKGYNELSLNTAWKATKNVDIAADIIAYIRTLALDAELTTPNERVKKAMMKLRARNNWNKIQQKWIDRFEKQLLAETVLTTKDFDLKPFIDEGGFKRLDKIFNHELESLIAEMNHELYSA